MLNSDVGPGCWAIGILRADAISWVRVVDVSLDHIRVLMFYVLAKNRGPAEKMISHTNGQSV